MAKLPKAETDSREDGIEVPSYPQSEGDVSGGGYARQPIFEFNPANEVEYTFTFPNVTFSPATGTEPIPTDTQTRIAEACDEIKSFLIAKNKQYGDSAIDPVRVFSRADPVEQLKVRIDDKLSRLARGDDSLESDEEILDDLIGYLILLKVARDAS